MQIIDKIKQAINSFTARDAMKVAWSLPPKRTSDLWMDMFHKSPMMDPINMIAQDVATAKYKLFNKAQYRSNPQEAEAYGTNPIFDLMDSPMPTHPEIDCYAIMYLTAVYYETVGEAFWLIDRDQRGRPIGIYIIPPTWCLLTPTSSVPYFRIQPMGNTSHHYFNADANDIVWFKALDATNPYGRGRARAEAIGDEIETHEFSAKYSKNFFYNDATPPVIFEMPGISKPDADAFKENWLQRLGGYLNARKPGVVAQAGFKVHQLGISPKEMDFTESRKYLIQTANEHFSVPPEMRGNLQNSNRATIDSAYYLWTKNVVSKRLRLFESMLNKQFVPMFDKTVIWVFDEIVPEDNEARMSIANAGLTAGTLTRNEWRKIASACGVVLAPDIGRGDVYLTGLMVQEVPAYQQPVKAEPEDKPEVPTADAEDNDAKAIDFDAVIKELGTATKNVESVGQKLDTLLSSRRSSWTEEQKCIIWKAFDKRATSVEPAFKAAVKKFSSAQAARVATVVKDITTANDIVPTLNQIFTDDADIALRRALAPAWLSGLEIGKANAKALAGKKAESPDTPDAFTNEWFNKWVNQAGLKKAKAINDTTHTALLRELQVAMSASIEAGDGLRAMTKKLLAACDGVYNNMDGARAELIARTEAGTSVNAGTFATYIVEGVEEKEWVSVRDDRTRDSGDEFNHLDMDGTIVGINEKFDVDGELLDYPGDPTASAGNVCNCRCTMVPVVKI